MTKNPSAKLLLTLGTALLLAGCSIKLTPSSSSSASSSEGSSDSSSSQSSASSEESSSSSQSVSSESSSSQQPSSSQQSSSSQESSSSEATSSEASSSVAPALEKTKLSYTYTDYANNNYYYTDSTPLSGNASLLVVPVWFSDSSKYISTTKRDALRDDIETAYFGSTSETGWHSVSSFYEAESRGKVHVGGVVTPWYEVSYTAKNATESVTQSLVSSAVEWYASTTGSSLSEFDEDNDGNLDGVMLIYAAPDDQTYSGIGNDNLWAYCSAIEYKGSLKKKPCVYFWASFDFMFSTKNTYSNYGGGDTRYCNIDAHTYIHEMGHAFGDDDYYDYANKWNPAGGSTMQDNNVGGHDPYTMMAFGWADPYVPTSSCEITLRPFESSGDLILLSPDFSSNSPFDEYLLLEYYTPTGVNNFDSLRSYMNGYPKTMSASGIRLWHVDARLVYTSTSTFSATKVTTNPKIKTGSVLHMMSNTTYSSGYNGYYSPLGKTYASYDLLHLIRNDTSVSYLVSDNMENGDLFRQGDSFTMDAYRSQFVQNGLLDTKKELPFSFEVTSITDEGATIQITKH